MKYSVALLLALFGLAAASILHQQEDDAGRSQLHNYFSRNWNNKNKWNNNDNNRWNSNESENNDSNERINNNSNESNNNDSNEWNNSNERNNDSNEWNNNDSNEWNTNGRNNERNKNRNNNRDWSNEDINNGQTNGNNLILKKQKVILQLLTNLQQKNTNQKLVQLGNNFNPVQNIDRFNNQQAVKKFLKNVQNNNILPKDEVFSVTNQQHQNQAAQLFTFLYSAQDWDTLKQAAAWARDRFNTDLYAFVLTSVVMNHPTTQGVVIPALFEIIPHAFIPATALHQIYKAKVQGINDVTVRATYTNQNRNNNNYNKNGVSDNNDINNKNNDNNRVGTHNPNNIFADNDGSLNNNAGTTENPENRVSYFTEDVVINDIHTRFHTQYNLFLGVNKNKNFFTSNLDNTNKVNTINLNKQDIKRGEAFYFAHQQLLARYVLERLSNNLPIPHPINLEDKIEIGYNPNLQHANGQAVPARPPKTVVKQHKLEDNNNNNNALMPNNNQAQNPKIYEQRLQQVAESGVVLNVDGTKTRLNKKNAVGILANLIAAPASSLNPDYYGDYFNTMKNAIGNIVDPNNQNGVAPGAVANLATAARDPVYYQLLVKLNQIFKNLQNKQGPYTKDELNMPGVKIENIDVSNLETKFETITVNVNNALPKNKHNLNNNNNYVNDILNNNNGNYNVKLQRLVNKPFDIKLTVNSNKNTNAIVRIFLGPKYDSNGQRFTLPQASQYFVQLDQFKVKLNNGLNRIVRNSQQTDVNVQTPVSIKQLLNRIEQGQVIVNKGEHQVLGLPLRSQLPKGKKNGQQFVLYTIINSLNNNNNNDDLNVESLEQVDSMEVVNMNLRRNNNNDINNSNENINNDETTNNNNNINNQILRKVSDNRSTGFPLDRPIVDVNYNTANQYFKTVTIHHRVNNDN